MTDLILHKHKHYIKEDLDYYFSGQRDVNNQIRPGENIYSLTPESQHFNIDFNDNKVGSLFFPLAPYSVDRIYIGISLPLFANNWGAAFLRHLLTRVKPGGCVVLPVYPEMQAAEKNYWSRSILENTFLSRSRWKGISNIWAENDGVMSMRIGRKFPAEINSSAAFFFEEAGNCILRDNLQGVSKYSSNQTYLFELGQKYWKAANIYSIAERIIHDYFGMKRAVTLCDIGNNHGLVSLEFLLSSYINVTQAVSFISDKTLAEDTSALSNRYSSALNGRFTPVFTSASDTLNFLPGYNVVCLINAMTNGTSIENISELLTQSMEALLPGGILIVYEGQGLPADVSDLLDSYQNIQYYSSIVASALQTAEVISHYSSKIEEELLSENKVRKHIFSVIQK